MNETYERAKEILKKYNQEQLLLKYEDLDKDKKEVLLNQILEIDFDLVNKLYKTVALKEEKEKTEENAIIEPIEYINKKNLTKEEKEYYTNLGIKEIKAKKLAAVTMAGRTRN